MYAPSYFILLDISTLSPEIQPFFCTSFDVSVIIESSRAIEIVAGVTITERFINARLATFVIHKIDGITGESLQG